MAEGGYSSPRIQNSGMFLSLPSTVWKPLEKMGIMAALRVPGCNMALGYMVYCFSREVYCCSVRRDVSPMILARVKFLKFHCVVRLQTVALMLMANP